MASMSEQQRDEFLATPRLGIFTQLRDDGAPVAVPVWFEWDGTVVRAFTGAVYAKVRRAQRDPRATLLATNTLDEGEAWVAFDGTVSVGAPGDGAIELAERLADRYWDMQEPEHQQAVAGWRAIAAHLVVLTLTPERIRTSLG